MSKAAAAARPSTLWKSSAWLLLPLAAGLLVYGNALGGEFVYDDNDQILKNPWVQNLHFLPDVLTRPVWAYQTTEPTNYYRPVQMGLYNLLWHVAGPNPLPFHTLSLLLHLLNVAALFLLIRGVSRSVPLAAGA